MIEIAARRARYGVLASGLVLEIGIGSGLNLPPYGPAVRCVVGLDTSPDRCFWREKRVAQRLAPVALVRASAQSIPFADATFDAIAMTWTLCSIPNPIAALCEMRRVLKPGGRLLFVEHGLSPETRIARWQHRLSPYWKLIGGGCHLDRKMDDLIRRGGFEIDALDTGNIRGLKPWSWLCHGNSVKAPIETHVWRLIMPLRRRFASLQSLRLGIRAGWIGR
jgi:SAM-dependent methyltransferase